MYRPPVVSRDHPDVQEMMSKGADLQSAIDYVTILDALEQQVGRLGFNAQRARGLIAVARERGGELGSPAASDVLRAAVVLLHATLEDYLRTLAASYLKFAPNAALNAVPLAGQGGDRPEKFFLGALGDFRHLSVLELIELSVSQHLERVTYNSARDVASLLEGLKLDLSEYRPFFKDLDEMMGRRHMIVHRADLGPNQQIRRLPDVTPIDSHDVERWADSVETFARLTTRSVSVARILERFPHLFQQGEKGGGSDSSLVHNDDNGA